MHRDVFCLKWFTIALTLTTCGAVHRTPNFIIDAPTPTMARQIGDAAEAYRSQLAVDWLGHEMPQWYAPCQVRVKVGQIGAGGATTFSFERARKGQMEVFGWRMTVQGSLERILDSVLPHEISHTVFACHFRRPLPRWADEGAATLAENVSERSRQVARTQGILKSHRRIPLRTLLALEEYPRDMQDVLRLYAQGYSLAAYLVQHGGKSHYLAFVDAALEHGWQHALQKLYGLRDIDELENRWSRWVLAGAPAPATMPDPREAIADAGVVEIPTGTAVVRSQSPNQSFERPSWRRAKPASRPTRPVASSNADAIRPTPVVRIGGHVPIAYGEGLHAPNPRSITATRLPSALKQAVWVSPSDDSVVFDRPKRLPTTTPFLPHGSRPNGLGFPNEVSFFP